jgi:hypothetical protein
MGTPFKLKSGNKPKFKNMGSSPTDIYAVTGDAGDVNIKPRQFHVDRSFTPSTDSESPKELRVKKSKEPQAAAPIVPVAKKPSITPKPVAPKSKPKVKAVKKDYLPKDFNITGGKSTTPGYSTTKAAKTENFRKEGRKTPTVRSTQVTPSGKVKVKSKLPKNFNAKGSSKAGKLPKVSKKPISTLSSTTKAMKNVPKQFANKAAANIGGKKAFGKIAKKVGSKFLGPVGAALTAYDVIKTAPKVAKATVKGLKERAKSGNVNIGRKL